MANTENHGFAFEDLAGEPPGPCEAHRVLVKHFVHVLKSSV